MMDTGYIKLHRDIQNSAEWRSEPFTRAQAWVDMLLSAAHKPTHVRIRGVRIDLERGQLALSVRQYADMWGWSRGKINRFLDELSTGDLPKIKIEQTNLTTIVSILDYDEEQSDGDPKPKRKRSRRPIPRSYARLLKDPRWQRRRLEVMQRDGWACQECGDTESTLHIHHAAYIGNPWDAPSSDLTTLCDDCHNAKHGREQSRRRCGTTFDRATEDRFDDDDLVFIPFGGVS